MCVAARVWVMELCRAMQTVAVKDGRNKTDKQIDRQTVGWAGRKAGRLAGWLAGWLADRNASWTWLITCQHYDEGSMYVCVCECAYLCVCAASQKLIRQSEIEYCSCKMVKCFFAQQQVLLVPLLSLSFYFSFYYLVLQAAVDAWYLCSQLYFLVMFFGFSKLCKFYLTSVWFSLFVELSNCLLRIRRVISKKLSCPFEEFITQFDV